MSNVDAATAPSHQRRAVALAILRQQGRFLMQLRDDDPNILYPGHWGFFGGHIEPGETAEIGVRRELLEEIGYCPTGLNLYDSYEDHQVIRHIYYGELDVEVSSLVLGEGLDLKLLALEDIQRGEHFSEKVNQVRPIGKPHQQILLNFIQQNS
ncbi:MAG: NUDIX domain-containing protein [Leptolyngbyaceae cyanobacterium bins.349]|nr:NUDIX domain-containing protein [Leptolyngbyaceae cyanobacterium bins.349]